MLAAPDPWTERPNSRPFTLSIAIVPDPLSQTVLRSCVPSRISTGPLPPAASPLHDRLGGATSGLPRTAIAMRGSAPCGPLAWAKGATPVVSRTLYGPSTRIFSKLVTPKLRVAALAGGAEAARGGAGVGEVA